MNRAVSVDQVRTRADFRAFLHLPWRIYADDPAWVPPLLLDLKTVLRRDKHPYHKHADTEYFLARQGHEVVGRIAASVNRLHNEFHEERTGFFGFFESIDDPTVARALLAAAEEWLIARGMQQVRGPMNFSTNEESVSPGVLIDGFDTPPVVMMSHNRPYYRELLEGAGYTKSKDLLSYWLDADQTPPALSRVMTALARREGISVRSVDLRRFEAEVATVQEIYNSAWERNWGFVPMTEAEFVHMAKQLRPVIDPDYALIAEVDGAPVAFAVGLPDYNQVLKRMNGRLLPLGIFKLLWYRRRIDALRVLTLGVKPGFRHLGLGAMLYLRIIENAQRAGKPRGECSWILEDNTEMRKAMERMGGRVYKTYRVMEKALWTSL